MAYPYRDSPALSPSGRCGKPDASSYLKILAFTSLSVTRAVNRLFGQVPVENLREGTRAAAMSACDRSG
jgi:hypothetical protein